MKKPLPFILRYGILSLLSFCLTISFAQAQTNPAPQSLPYFQDFGVDTFSLMPAGMAAWTVQSSPKGSQSSAESSVDNGDAIVHPDSTIQTTGDIYGYATGGNARTYIQTSSNSTNGTSQIALSISTLGHANITVAYNVEMISANPRTIGDELQYRVGTTGTWTTLSGTSYSHNNTDRSNGDIDRFSGIVLPGDAENDSLVQIRWITWRGSEAGYSSGVAIDSINVTGSDNSIFYYRSVASGDWNNPASWEFSTDSTNWRAATLAPDYHAKTIVVQTNDSIAITTNDTIDQTIVNGILVYSDNGGNAITINDGAGTDLTINGTYEDIGTVSNTWLGSATWTMGADGTLLRTQTTSSNKWRDSYAGGISNIPATANWIIRKTGVLDPSLSSTGGMYYPNLSIENTTDSPWITTSGSTFQGSSDYPRIKGNLDIGSNSSSSVTFVDSNTNATPIPIGGNLTIQTNSTFRVAGTGVAVNKDFTDNGTLQYGTSNNATLTFNGSTNQTLSGNGTLNIFNFTLSQSSASDTLFLTRAITVDSVFTITQGILDCQRHQLTNSAISGVGVSPSPASTCSGNPVTLTASNYNSYLWTPATGLSDTVGTTVDAAPNTTTVYTVYGSAGNEDGCAIGIDTVLVTPITSASCANALTLSSNQDTDYAFHPCQNSMWFSFVADSTRKLIEIATPVLSIDTPFAHIDSLVLYSGTCANDSVLQIATYHGTDYADSTPAIQYLNFMPGQTYKLKVVKANDSEAMHNEHFSIQQENYPQAILSSCTISPCSNSLELLINSDFDSVPSWAAGGEYLDDSYIYHATADGSPQNTYAIHSPNMRFHSAETGTPCSPNDLDGFDEYYITSNPLSLPYSDVAESGSYNMIVDCPAQGCRYCSSSGYASGCSSITTVLNTDIQGHNYTCEPWEQQVSVTAGSNYTFSTWIHYIDYYNPTLNGSPNPNPPKPGAFVWIQINDTTYFQDVINYINYHDWQHVCFNWTAPVGDTLADITVFGQGNSSSSGYDFALDNFSFKKALPEFSVASVAICPGDSTVLSVIPADSNMTYTWAPATGLNTTSGASVVANPTSTTTYTITESDGNCTATTTATVTIRPKPTVTVSPQNASVCQSGDSTTLTASGATFYFWSPSTGLSTTTGATTTVSVTGNATYSVEGIYTLNGCPDTAYANVSIATPPALPVSPIDICTGDTTGLNPIGFTPNHYSWAGPGLSCTSCTNPTVSPSATTTYSVTVTSFFTGCTNSGTVTVIVGPKPPLPTIDTLSICAGDSIHLFPTGYDSTDIYNWSGTGLSCTACANPSVSPSSTSSYTVVASDTSGGCTDSATIIVYVTPLAPLPTIDTLSICAGDSVHLFPTGYDSTLTYHWSGVGLSCTACANPYVSPSSNSSYTVVTSDSTGGCADSATVMVYVHSFAPLPSISTLSMCAGDSVHLFAIGYDSTDIYHWSGTGLSCTTCANPTVSPGSTSTYTVVASDGTSGCADSAIVMVNVHPFAPLPTVDTLSICAGDSAHLFPSGYDTTFTYHWSGTGLSCTTCANPSVSPSSNSSYTVVASDSTGGCADSATIIVNVYPVASKPDTLISICPGDTAYLFPNAPSSSYVYNWSGTGLSCTSCTNPFVKPDTTSTYTVIATDTIGGCTDTATVTVHVYPAASMPNPKNIIWICQGDSAQLFPNAPGSSSYVYTWSGTGLSCTTCIDPSASPGSTSIYSVVATDTVNGCIDSAKVAIHVYPGATMPDSMISICQGDTAQLFPNAPSSSYVYNWSGTGLSCTSCTNPSVSPDSNSIYTVVATDTIGGCTDTAMVTVIVHPAASMPDSITSVCIGDTIPLFPTAPNPTNYTYTWSGTGLSCTVCENPTVSPSVATTYTVVATDSVNGCSYTSYVNVSINQGCCSAPSAYTYYNDSTSAIGAGLTNVPQISIAGTFIVNSNFSFTDCQSVDMATNAQIIVEAPETLTITDSRLWACDSMWNGIQVQPGAYLIVQNDGNGIVTAQGQSIIEDAKYAIEGQTDNATYTTAGNISITNSRLNNNFVDMQVDQYENTSNYYPLTMHHVVLTTSPDAPYSPSEALKAPHALTDTITQIGIKLDSVRGKGIVIGDAAQASYRDTFSIMNYGIKALNSNFEVYNNEFDSLGGYGDATAQGSDPDIGIAILANADMPSDSLTIAHTNSITTYHVIVGGQQTNQSNKMLNCFRGVDVTSYLDAKVLNNTFTNISNIPTPNNPPVDGDMAVFIKPNVAVDSIIMRNNTVVNCNTGLDMLGGPIQVHRLYGNAVRAIVMNSNDVYITDTLHGHMRTGIIAQNMYETNLRIDSNIVDSAAVCIKVSHVTYDIGIDYNKDLRIMPYPSAFNVPPYYDAPYKEAGIWIENSVYPLDIAGNNHIYATGTVFKPDTANPNMADTSVIGIYVVFTRGHSRISCNTMYDVGQCLRFDGSCNNDSILNNHLADGTAASCFDGLVLENNGVIGPQEYYSPTNSPQYGPINDHWPLSPMRSATYTWNSNAGNSELFVAGSGPSPNLGNHLNLAYGNAPGSISYNTIGPTLVCGTQSFYRTTAPGDGNANRGISTDNTASNLSYEQLQMDKIVEDSMDYQVFVAPTRYMDKQWVYEELNQDPTLMQGDAKLQSFFAQAHGNNMGAIYRMEQDIEQGNYSAAQSINNSIVPTNAIEQNYQAVNGIYFQAIAAGTSRINSTQYNTLYGIASQCPLEGGRAVYKARYMLDYYMDTHYTFTDNCSGNTAQRINGIQENEDTYAKVYPNPADNSLSIITDKTGGEFCLYNSTGQKVMCNEVYNKRISFSISNLPSGLYYYRLSDGHNQLIKGGKITIIH